MCVSVRLESGYCAITRLHSCLESRNISLFFLNCIMLKRDMHLLYNLQGSKFEYALQILLSYSKWYGVSPDFTNVAKIIYRLTKGPPRLLNIHRHKNTLASQPGRWRDLLKLRRRRTYWTQKTTLCSESYLIICLHCINIQVVHIIVPSTVPVTQVSFRGAVLHLTEYSQSIRSPLKLMRALLVPQLPCLGPHVRNDIPIVIVNLCVFYVVLCSMWLYVNVYSIFKLDKCRIFLS